MTRDRHGSPSGPGHARLSRRRMLKIVAVAGALPAGVLGLRELSPTPAPVEWFGEVMNAPARLTLWHPDSGVVRRALTRIRVETARLDDIFGLDRPHGELARLNATGRLDAPSKDLVSVLELAQEIGAISRGAFDPTIQPLWKAYARHFAQPAAAPEGPDPASLDRLRPIIGYEGIEAASRAVVLARAGMALSLNGIAQGYITDRVTDLLRNEGFDHAMVEMGESRALGTAPDGAPFPVRLLNPFDPNRMNRRVDLSDAALSVSGGYGTRFSETAHHLFDPATGRSAQRVRDVAVMAPRAVLADALSTAIYVGGEAAAPRILAAYPTARAWLTRNDGSQGVLTAPPSGA
ncbi:FAD:protein FMN transferase [Roseitranquillus sediminis]|uniref:FAD:protein FMN transferase n=1 Tax=Roseitranquillus sediminis TaxID=2809051 RepID=UPI001D0BFC29|nr:FAD:protein FMN transferase [Roseitranquillus sediminis]MBM9593193.1 FAD:protein FMN transferase [Roseitranquillus sediminis]